MGSTLYLEDFEIGKAYVSKSRTITEADVVNFAGVSGDFNPLHMSDEVGKKSMFGKRIAHGALGFVISNGLENQMGLFDDSLIAFVECTVKYLAPLMIGDTVHMEFYPTEIIKTSKPGRGILKKDLYLVNQDGKRIMESKQVIMLKTRPEE